MTLKEIKLDSIHTLFGKGPKCLDKDKKKKLGQCFSLRKNIGLRFKTESRECCKCQDSRVGLRHIGVIYVNPQIY
jgi:hypothetical protein